MKPMCKKIFAIEIVMIALIILFYGYLLIPKKKQFYIFHNTITQQKVMDTYTANMYGFDQDMDTTEIVVKDSLGRLPWQLLNQFYNEGNAFSLRSGITFMGPNWSTGYFSPGETMYDGITIRNNKDLDKYRMRMPILHEFGHYFDHVNGMLSESEEWKQITAEEAIKSQSSLVMADDGVTPYYSTPVEFFAQEFAYSRMMDVDGRFEEARCPKAQAFIKKYMNEYLANYGMEEEEP